jgi:hypothetical protein
MPAKVNVLIGFLADLYGPHPYWDKDLDIARVSEGRLASRPMPRRMAKGAGSAVATR